MDQLQAATAALKETTCLLEAATASHVRALAAVAELIEEGVEGPFNAPFKPPSTTGDHRRAHRPGKPRKIDADPELRAFIRARLDHMTFPELAAAVTEAFPRDRRVGKSAIHAWWKRQRPT